MPVSELDSNVRSPAGARWRWPIEALLALYLLCYLPSIVETRLLSHKPIAALGRSLSGLELLPSTLMLSMLMTMAFIWACGWHRDANQLCLGGLSLPWPRRATLWSGFATSLILFTVPLSLTFKGVSIPFIQLIMRGDVLILAPLVDVLFGRRVRWWSWLALTMVALALLITLQDRGGLNLPPLAVICVVLYTGGYFLRLMIMTRVGKSTDPAVIRAYFVEEKVVALPLSIIALAALSLLGEGRQGDELALGFIGIWRLGLFGDLLMLSLTMTAVSILSLLILLDPRENAFCVALERAVSLIAGVGAAMVLAWGWGLPAPSVAEWIGAAMLIAAVTILSLAPRLFKLRAQAAL